jgi:hypothetical protein
LPRSYRKESGMTTKPIRREKRRGSKRRKLTFTIIVEAQPMLVSYEPRGLAAGYAHFEFRSPHNPASRIPVSETGYLSHFAATEDVRKARTPQNYARAVVLATLNSAKTRPSDPRQFPLFR